MHMIRLNHRRILSPATESRMTRPLWRNILHQAVMPTIRSSLRIIWNLLQGIRVFTHLLDSQGTIRKQPVKLVIQRFRFVISKPSEVHTVLEVCGLCWCRSYCTLFSIRRHKEHMYTLCKVPLLFDFYRVASVLCMD